MTDKPLTTCPTCQATSLVQHCGSPTCTWRSCRNQKCDLTFDVVRLRGNALTEDGKARRNVTIRKKDKP